MGNKYNGKYGKKTATPKGCFNWTALILWYVSLAVSLIPMYIELIKYINDTGYVDALFGVKIFVEGDILWVFSTLLLFVLVDSFLKNRKKEKEWVNILFIIGVVLFVFLEATWIVFYYLLNDVKGVWPLFIGVPLIAVSLIISTPLKIEFIKED